jgi:ATP-dependent Clp protease ATP-binding subunit ClpA
MKAIKDKDVEYFTREQLDIELLKQQNSSFQKTLERIELRLDSIEHKIDANFIMLDTKIDTNFITLDTKIDSKFQHLENKINTHFHWMLGVISGLYTITITTLIAVVCKAYGWF